MAPRRNPSATIGLSRLEYASYATPMTTAISDVAKTGPGTLPTYSLMGSMGAALGGKSRQMAIGSSGLAPLGLRYLSVSPRVISEIAVNDMRPAWARTAGA